MAPRSSKEFAEIAKSSYNFMLVNTTIEVPQIGFLFEFQLNLSFFRSDTLSHVLCPPSGTVLRVAEWRYVPLFPHLKTEFYNLVVFESKGTLQKLLSGFCPLRGGVPPLSAKLFGHNDFPLRGGGVPPQFL